MSVFTTLTLDEARELLRDFAIGEITALKGIAAGITNTNYFVITQNHRYVLTIFEKSRYEDLPYFVNLMAHLAKRGILCPAPIADKHGVSLHRLKDKPVLMVSCLSGEDAVTPNDTQIAQVATALAQMHLAGKDFTEVGVNQRDAAWFNTTAHKVLPKLQTAEAQLLQAELDYQMKLDTGSLPRGVVHGDLFRDNVLFDGDKLGGFIDFYYACNDILLYDVAIAVNEWCLHHHGSDLGQVDETKIEIFLAAYQQLRPFEKQEWKLWLAMLRRAALRFWLSRLNDFYFPQSGELTYTKDPSHFRNLLQQYLDLADDLGDK